MAELRDYRMTGSDETPVTMETYMNDQGDVILALRPPGEEVTDSPTVFITMNLMEAKRLREDLLVTIESGITELTREG